MPFRFTLIVFALAVVGDAVAPAIAQNDADEASGGSPPAIVRVDEARVEELQRRWGVVGRLEETRRSIVASEQEGRVIELAVDEGDVVEGNKTVLVRIDEYWKQRDLETAEARRLEAEAQVDEARANVEQARRDYQLLKQLWESGSAKRKEMDDAKTALDAQQARLARAEALVQRFDSQVRRVREQIKRLTVVAPFDGVVVEKHAEVGQWLTEGEAIVEIVSRGHVDARIHVPESIVNDVTIGQELEVQIAAIGDEVGGKVIAVVPIGAEAARTYPVKVRLPDKEGRLKPGMSVTVRLPTGKMAPVTTVPRAAVLLGRGGGKVWMVMDNKAFPVEVDVLFGHDDRYAVRTKPSHTGPPLREGASVIIEGAERLMFPGQPVTLMKQPASAQPTAASTR